MKASDKRLSPKGGHMEVIVLITAFASAGAFISRIIIENKKMNGGL